MKRHNYVWLIGAAVLVACSMGALWLSQSPETLLSLAVRRERAGAALVAKQVTLPPHEVVYLEGGAPEGPHVLLLHGFAADKDNWTRFSRSLRRAGFHIHAPDLPGHGESNRLHEYTYDIPNQVAFVAAFLDATGIQSVHLAGNSMGGHIAAAFAATHPDRVLSLGLFNAGGVTAPVTSERQQMMDETGVNPLLVESLQDFDRLLEFVFVVPPPMPTVVKQYFADRAVTNRTFNDKIYADLSLHGRLMPLEPLLPRVTAPSLILWGDTDRVLHPSGAAVLAAGLPDSETVIMSDMGHSPMIERPEETASIYIEFLTRSIEDR